MRNPLCQSTLRAVRDERITESQVASDPEHRLLQVLLGRWHTSGRTYATASAPSAEIDATDTYEWLPGGLGLIHTVKARVGDERVEGAEVIEYDPSREAYVTHYVGTDGPNSYEARLTEEDGELVWRMQSDRNQFTGVFDDDGTTISGCWELRGDDGRWRLWMEITLTKAR
jgi:Protein of unknown function (DUF1579)